MVWLSLGILPCEHVTIMPLLSAMSTPVTVLSWPLSSSLRTNFEPDRLYNSTLLSRATAKVCRSDEKEWSAIGWWKRWCTSGPDIATKRGFVGDRSSSLLPRELRRIVIRGEWRSVPGRRWDDQSWRRPEHTFSDLRLPVSATIVLAPFCQLVRHDQNCQNCLPHNSIKTGLGVFKFSAL